MLLYSTLKMAIPNFRFREWASFTLKCFVNSWIVCCLFLWQCKKQNKNKHICVSGRGRGRGRHSKRVFGCDYEVSKTGKKELNLTVLSVSLSWIINCLFFSLSGQLYSVFLLLGQLKATRVYSWSYASDKTRRYKSIFNQSLRREKKVLSMCGSLLLTLMRWIMASLKNTRSMPAPRILSLYCSRYIFSLSSRPSNDGIFTIKKNNKLRKIYVATRKYKRKKKRKRVVKVERHLPWSPLTGKELVLLHWRLVLSSLLDTSSSMLEMMKLTAIVFYQLNTGSE